MEQAQARDLEPAVIELARRGDTRAFARIVAQFQTPVYNLAYRMLGSAPEAEDAAQETFLRAYSRLKSYDPHQAFAPWLLSIATHYCIDRLRRRKFLWMSIDDDTVRESLPTHDPGPEEQALDHERVREVQHLLQHLPPASRAVVVLKYWNDLSVEEISRITGDSVSSVKVKLYRARQAMARELNKRPQSAPAKKHGVEGAIHDASGCL